MRVSEIRVKRIRVNQGLGVFLCLINVQQTLYKMYKNFIKIAESFSNDLTTQNSKSTYIVLGIRTFDMQFGLVDES